MKTTRKIKHIIHWFVPYGAVKWYASKHRSQDKNDVEEESQICTLDESFLSGFRKYLAENSKVQFTDNSPFEVVVSVQGFGFSGSGALVDLLREYDSTFVIGSVDYEGSLATRDQHCVEVDILRLAGGLFEIEKYLGSNNIFQNDALLHRVMAQIENSDIYMSLSAVRPYFYEFFYQISEVLTNSPQWQYYNAYLDYKGVNDIFYLKDITLKDYRNLCRKLLNSLFSIIKGDSMSSILVLDQFVCDMEFDMTRYLDYVPNLKVIAVYRDPRDIYTFAIKDNVEWIPHNNVDVFIRWYQMMIRNFDVNEKEKYHVVQFEQLIEDYETAVKSMEQYVGLDASSHIRKNSCLNPSVSRQNMYLWTQNTLDEASYVEIQSKLNQLCYKNN